MKILIVHNEYGKFSGEELVVQNLLKVLTENGHYVSCFRRSSADIPGMKFGKIKAFINGIYSFSSKITMRRYLHEIRPDVVHVHNLFPFISPSVLKECSKAKIPIVMTVHNYRLVCPNGLHLKDGRVCEKCCYGREYYCFLHNCEKNYLKSMGYFLRSYFARKSLVFKREISMFSCLTEFQRQRLINEGFDKDKIAVVPNMIKNGSIELSKLVGQYVGFIGRISPEKGVDTLVEAAKRLSQIRFQAAGAFDGMEAFVESSPNNFEFSGLIDHGSISGFYQSSRIIVLSSIWFEGFPMVLLEAMLSGRPIIASNIGGLPEIVDDKVTGFLFEPGNVDELANKIVKLWENPKLCHKMGQAGRAKVLREYSPEKYYNRLMKTYKRVLNSCKV